MPQYYLYGVNNEINSINEIEQRMISVGGVKCIIDIKKVNKIGKIQTGITSVYHYGYMNYIVTYISRYDEFEAETFYSEQIFSHNELKSLITEINKKLNTAEIMKPEYSAKTYISNIYENREDLISEVMNKINSTRNLRYNILELKKEYIDKPRKIIADITRIFNESVLQIIIDESDAIKFIVTLPTLYSDDLSRNIADNNELVHTILKEKLNRIIENHHMQLDMPRYKPVDCILLYNELKVTHKLKDKEIIEDDTN